MSENPKAAFGRKKIDFGAIPPVALAYIAAAMDEGADKYGLENFLETPIRTSDYTGPLGRHYNAWRAGSDIDAESGLPELAKLAANCIVLLSAWHHGTLKDERRKVPDYDDLMVQLNAKKVARLEALEAKRRAEEAPYSEELDAA